MTELTDENRRDLELLQMRAEIDPKSQYRKNDLKVLPKYFQVVNALIFFFKYFYLDWYCCGQFC